MSRFASRLTALEAVLHTAEEAPRFFVIYIGSEEPADLRDEDIVTYLPRKFASPEEWAAAMRKEFGYLMDGPPDDNLDE
jgi:hypothetical protein